MDKNSVGLSRSAVRLGVRGVLAAAVLWFGGWFEQAGAAFTENLDSHNASLWTKADGWTNGGMFNVGWKADHVTFSGGVMSLRLDNVASSGRPYSSGEYRTNAKYGYGRVEGTFKAAKGSGLVTGLFTYTGPNEGDPWDEIDIEILGKDTTKMQTNYFTNGTGLHETMINLGFDAALGMNSYAFEWSANSIKWFVKKAGGSWVLVHTENGSRGPLPTHPGKIMANLWAFTGANTTWTGPFTYTGAVYAQFDQIYYGPAGTTASPSGDATAPSVSLTAPAAGATVSGSALTVAAYASDNVGVAGVQFKLDGVNIGAEDTTAPYSTYWNTTLAANGWHSLTAVARDAAGNKTTSAGRSVNVSNSGSSGSTSFSDDFNSGVPTGWTPISGSWGVSGGQYGQSNLGLYRALTTAGSTWGDATVSASMNIISGGQDLNQILLRYVDANNYVAAYISKYWGCIGLEQLQGGVRSYSQVPFSFSYNTWFTMKAAATGGQAQVYFNGALMHTWTLPNGTTKGKIGLGNSVSTARFDNVAVSASAAVSASFSEYFSGGTSAWTPVYGSWAVSSGQYTQTNTSLYRALSVAGGQFGNLTLQGSVRVAWGGQDLNSLVFRYKDSSNYCAVYLSKYWGRIGIEQLRGGVRSYSEAAFASSYNTTYTLKAVVSGGTVSAYVNGALKHTWTLPDGATTGRIGVSNSASAAYFDNITAAAGTTKGTLSPTATFKSLANGAIVGTSMKVAATGSDDEGVTRVELLADGAVAGSQDFSPPVPSFTTSLSWGTSVIGAHSLQILTYDTEGNQGSSAVMSVNVSNKAGSKVSLVSTQGLSQAATEQEPRALMLSPQQASGAALAFSEDVEEAAVVDMRGRAVMQQRKQGSPILMSFRQSSGGRLPMESGLWLIQMKDKDGQIKVKPLIMVK